MKTNKRQTADIFGVTQQAIDKWHSEGLPVEVKGAREARKELRTPPVKPLQTAQEGPGKAERKGPEEGTGKRHHVIIDGFYNLAGDPIRDQVIKKLLADLSPTERELVRQIH